MRKKYDAYRGILFIGRAKAAKQTRKKHLFRNIYRTQVIIDNKHHTLVWYIKGNKKTRTTSIAYNIELFELKVKFQLKFEQNNSVNWT